MALERLHVQGILSQNVFKNNFQKSKLLCNYIIVSAPPIGLAGILKNVKKKHFLLKY